MLRIKNQMKRHLHKVPQIFDRNSKRMQQNRNSQQDLAKKTTYLKDEIADRLVDRFLDINRQFPNVLDLGAGSGHIVKYVDSEIVTKKLTQFDNCKDLLQRDSALQYSVNTERVVGDLEKLPFSENTFDAVVSNLSLHWVNDLTGTLVQVKNCLVPDGVFIAAMFSNDTLFELRTSLQLAETERKNGISAHISPMVRHQDVGSLLSRAGFTLTTVDVDEIVVNFPSMFELMEDLRAMGESNAILDRKFVGKDIFMAAASIYKEIYGNVDGTIPATFQIVYMIGWKPCETQPKPLPRGSAKHSFKELEQLK